MRWTDAIRSLLLGPLLRGFWYYSWRPLLAETKDPGAAQLKVLRGLLARNRDTRFGEKYAFGSIYSVRDFQTRVPWNNYEALRPYIEEQERTGGSILLAEPPVMYARTSGTTGKHKLVPITESGIAQYRRQQRLLTALQYRIAPRAFKGKALAIVSPAVEGHLESGRPYGSMSGYVYRTMPALVRSSTVVPPSVLEIEDYDMRYFVILRLALAERNITYLGTANPSTFLRLAGALEKNGDALIESVRTGQLPNLNSLPETARSAIRPQLYADPTRARELEHLADSGELNYARIWPHIALVTTWTAANCQLPLGEFRAQLPPEARVLELGYVASEFRGTMTVDPESGGGLPLLTDHFFEFVERTDWELGREDFLTLDQLEHGKDYYIFVTTGALYRYAMDDIMRVVGFKNRTPLLRFQQKGKGCTSITGEKLYEAQVLEALEVIARKTGFRCPFFMLIADEEASAYELVAEPPTADCPAIFADELDRSLAERNIEYAGKRESGRLGALRVRWLKPGTGEAYVRHCVAKGQREGQFKYLALQYRKEVSFPFEKYAA
jgi:hypothetical protein